MVSQHSSSGLRRIVALVARATVAQAIGRSVNILLAFSVLFVLRPGAPTDAFFLMLSIAFYGYGTVANSLVDASVPLLGRDGGLPSRHTQHVVALVGGAAFVLAWAVIGKLSWMDGLPFAVAGALMVYGGLGASFAVARLHYHSHFVAPGLSWLVRIVPVGAFLIFAKTTESLTYLALALGIVDLMRWWMLSQLAGPGVDSQAAGRRRVGGGEVAKHYAAVLLASSISGINPIVDRWIVSLGASGNVSLLDMGERLFGIVATLSAVGIGSVSLVAMTRDLKLTTDLKPWYRLLGLTAVIATGWVVLALLAGWLVLPMVFRDWLSFSAVQGGAALNVYRTYVVGILPFLLGVVCVRRFMAERALRWLVAVAVVSAASNAALSYLLFTKVGVVGVSLATTFVYCLTAVVMIFAIHWRHVRQ